MQGPTYAKFAKKTFNRVSTLISYRRTHFDDKPHKCHICGKGFHQKGNLKNHLFSHTNERVWPYDIFTFLFKYIIKFLILFLSQPYRCEICGRGFNQMSYLVVHKMKLHGQASPTESSARSLNMDKFPCKLCDEKFPRKTSLVVHEEQRHNLIKSKSSIGRKNRAGGSNQKLPQVNNSLHLFFKAINRRSFFYLLNSLEQQPLPLYHNPIAIKQVQKFFIPKTKTEARLVC